MKFSYEPLKTPKVLAMASIGAPIIFSIYQRMGLHQFLAMQEWCPEASKQVELLLPELAAN